MALIFSFLLPSIRDYIDTLNTLYDSVSGNINLQHIVQESFTFIFASIKFSIFYILSFQWIQDLAYLPILVPPLKLEILKEHFFLQTPQSNFFTFLETPSYINNELILGFLNSFFLCLPLSVAHLISTRRLLIQGLAAGIFSSLGTICSEILLLSCILFGGRYFIIPWFNFQTINYLIGICIVLNLVYEMVHERSIRIIDISNKFLLFKIFLLNFFLTWTEQSCIFQYFRNITFGPEPTIIEIFSSPNELGSLLTHINYIMGIILGSLIFTSLNIFLCLKVSTILLKLQKIPFSRWINRLNRTLIVLIISFTFTSIPFYTFDYLVLSNFGVVSQDKTLKNSVFYPTKLNDHNRPVLGLSMNPTFDSLPGIDTDITPFDRGRYLLFNASDAFEQVNYQGEYGWTSRMHHTTTVNKNPARSPVFSKIAKVFYKFTNVQQHAKSRENRYREIRAENRKKESRANLQSTNEKIKKVKKNRKNIEELIDINTSIKLDDTRERQYNRITNFFGKIIDSSVSDFFKRRTDFKFIKFENRFKQRYYLNPVYKLLLGIDIDFFLSRQPKSFKLTEKQENELFAKRLCLSDYYDSLSYYTKLPTTNEFKDDFHRSKTYANRVYNQQYKGTSKIVRRLFSVNIDINDPEISQKFSLTSFITKKKPKTKGRNPKNPFLNRASIIRAKPKVYKDKSDHFRSIVLKFDQPLYKKFDKQENSLVHEELNIKRKFPFIKPANPIPFYVGWDEQLRKLVITNRLSPQSFTSYSMRFSTKHSNTNYPTLNPLIQKNKTINFTTWPLPHSVLDNSEFLDKIPYNTLFYSLADNNFKTELLTELQEEKKGSRFDFYDILDSIPSNIAKRYRDADTKIDDIIPPTRGGFVWPGHSDLKFNFKKITNSSKSLKFNFKKLINFSKSE